MSKVGIICDLMYKRHHLFQSYYHSVTHFYGPLKVVKTVPDLEGLEILFIGDDHYQVHKEVWQQNGFIRYCNIHKIKVVVLTNEKILNSFFPWNKDNLLRLKELDYLYHYTNDVDDCDLLGLKLNRQAMSKFFKPYINIPKNKKDKVLFIGRTDCASYVERKEVIREVQKYLEMDIVSSTIPLWEDYLNLISEYKYVLSPIGNGNFFPMRFYEALAVKSIPIHQVRGNTLDLYNIESKFEDCIFFKNPAELKDKLRNFTSPDTRNELWMEDNLEVLLKLDNLL